MGSGASAADQGAALVTRDEAKSYAGPRWNEVLWSSFADGPKGESASKGAFKDMLVADAAQQTINYEAVTDLQADADCSRGRLLVNLKDRIGRVAPILKLLLTEAASEAERDPACKDLGRDDFRRLVTVKLGCEDLLPEQCDSHFFEAGGWPDDEDDESQVRAIRLDLGLLATALVRVANDLVVALGDTTIGLDEQLCLLLRKHASAALAGKIGAKTVDELCAAPLRDPAFFTAPPAFVAAATASPVRCFLDFAIGDWYVERDIHGEDDEKDPPPPPAAADRPIVPIEPIEPPGAPPRRRVVFELAVDVAPATAYNFFCLCTGERGRGEVSGEVLCYRASDHSVGCGIHRVVPGLCIQGGDFTVNDGNGGESVYGGQFMDESFAMKHDAPYILSSANAGPNTNSSQFFVTLAAAPSLDGVHCAFGRVVEGSDVIDDIGALAADDDDTDEAPTDTVHIVDCGAVPAAERVVPGP